MTTFQSDKKSTQTDVKVCRMFNRLQMAVTSGWFVFLGTRGLRCSEALALGFPGYSFTEGNLPPAVLGDSLPFRLPPLSHQFFCRSQVAADLPAELENPPPQPTPCRSPPAPGLIPFELCLDPLPRARHCSPGLWGRCCQLCLPGAFSHSCCEVSFAAFTKIVKLHLLSSSDLQKYNAHTPHPYLHPQLCSMKTS